MTRGKEPTQKYAISAAALIAVATVSLLAGATAADGQSLDTFAILGGSTITNTGTSVIVGNIGVSPGSAITGKGPGADQIVLTGAYFQADGVAVQAKSDLATTYNVLMNRPVTEALVGNELGGRTLTAGVYSFESEANLNGTLTLQGDADDVFIIQVPAGLTTASNSSVAIAPGSTVNPANVFFVVGSSATLGTNTDFMGQIVALTSISLLTGTTIDCGAAWARNGAVTLDTNEINVCVFDVSDGEIGEDLDDGDTTDNEQAVIDAINDYLENGGTLPLGFLILDLLTPEELADLLEQIAGETGTGVAPSIHQSMNSFLDLVTGPHGGMAMAPLPGETMGRGTVSVMGYAPSPAPAGQGAFEGFDQGPAYPDVADWTIWAAGFGGNSLTEGNASIGSHDRTVRDMGVAVGVDYHLSEGTLVGVAASAGVTDFALADEMGSGNSQMFQAAIYGRADGEMGYVAGALAYAYHSVETERRLAVAGEDVFNANFGAHNIAGEIEVGYHVGWFTPYAAVRGQTVFEPAYAETTTSGASTFALGYAENEALSARVELGALADWETTVEGGNIGLHVGAAWGHYLYADNDVNAEFLALPGSSFVIEGAQQATDAVLITAGAEITFDSGLAFAGSVNGEFAENFQSYGGSFRLSQSW